jgi:hypothetical protein
MKNAPVFLREYEIDREIDLKAILLRQTKGQVYANDRGRKLEFNNLKGTKLGSPSWESGPESGPHRELRVEFSRCSGLLRLGTVLHSHSSGLLIHRSGHSHVSRSGNGIWRGQDSGASIWATASLLNCSHRVSNLHNPTSSKQVPFQKFPIVCSARVRYNILTTMRCLDSRSQLV